MMMNDKTKEMIAIGVAYAINCKPCMELRKEMAIKACLNQELYYPKRIKQFFQKFNSQKSKIKQ